MMTPEQFAYWLNGFAELTGAEPPTPAQWKSIVEHLGTVFKKVTPPVNNGLGPLQPFKPGIAVAGLPPNPLEDLIRRSGGTPADAWPPRGYDRPGHFGPDIIC